MKSLNIINRIINGKEVATVYLEEARKPVINLKTNDLKNVEYKLTVIIVDEGFASQIYACK